jgi:hypothetical protein
MYITIMVSLTFNDFFFNEIYSVDGKFTCCRNMQSEGNFKCLVSLQTSFQRFYCHF